MSTTENNPESIENREEDFFRNLYDKFELSKEIRRETFDEDIGQNSWMMADEQKKYISWLKLDPEGWILDVACGAGGPSINLAILTNCNLIGIDVQDGGIANGNKLALSKGVSNRVRFELHDASEPLSYASEMFDAVICIDSICHFHHRIEFWLNGNEFLNPAAVFYIPTHLLSQASCQTRK